MREVVRVAQRLGIVSPMQANASIALGTSEVTPIELTGAYAAFANGGAGVIPYVITRVETADGHILFQRVRGGLGRVIDDEAVAMMNAMMHETMVAGTARRAALPDWQGPGVKGPGPSQGFRDAWFVGYTATLVDPVSGSAMTTTARRAGPRGAICPWISGAGFMEAALAGDQSATAARRRSLGGRRARPTAPMAGLGGDPAMTGSTGHDESGWVPPPPRDTDGEPGPPWKAVRGLLRSAGRGRKALSGGYPRLLLPDKPCYIRARSRPWRAAILRESRSAIETRRRETPIGPLAEAIASYLGDPFGEMPGEAFRGYGDLRRVAGERFPWRGRLSILQSTSFSRQRPPSMEMLILIRCAQAAPRPSASRR